MIRLYRDLFVKIPTDTFRTRQHDNNYLALLLGALHMVDVKKIDLLFWD